jgi:hypothetical protein
MGGSVKEMVFPTEILFRFVLSHEEWSISCEKRLNRGVILLQVA